MDPETRAIRHLYRTNLSSFIGFAFRLLFPQRTWQPHWTVDAIAGALEKCERNEFTRLIINLPPRYLKSVAASVAFPAWVLARQPEARVICVTNHSGLLEQHHVQSMRLMNHPKYRALFPHVQITERGRRIVLSHGGSRNGFTIGGGITGHGADFIVIDDPLPARAANDDTARQRVNDWYDQNIYQRLDDKSRGVVIVAMQRLHVDDLTGHIQHQPKWKGIVLPAIANSDVSYFGRIVQRKGEALNDSVETKAQLRDAMLRMGAKAFMAQYQQDPYALGKGEGRHGWYSSLRVGVRWRPEHGHDIGYFGSVSEERILLHTVFGEGEHPWPDNMRNRMELDEWVEYCNWSQKDLHEKNPEIYALREVRIQNASESPR